MVSQSVWNLDIETSVFYFWLLYPETLVGKLREDFEDKLKKEEKKMEAALAKGEISLFRSKAKPTQT